MYTVPEMILFDYGQTLVAEEKFNPLAGNAVLLNIACCNPNHVTAQQVQALADSLSSEIDGSYTEQDRNRKNLEISCYAFDRYLYEYLGVGFDKSHAELEWLFWSHSGPGKPTKNIELLLDYLRQKGIRTGVVSNMMNSTESLKRRLKELLPKNHFEFVIASSDYVFRKPHKRIFELAQRKAGLPADRIWFCGDNQICDIEGAYLAGMKPIWYPAYIDSHTPAMAKVPCVTVNDWIELIEMIELQTSSDRLLLYLDRKDYNPNGNRFARTAVRGLIKKGDQFAMIHSAKYGEYKFPGGGMEQGEQLEETLIREVAEETGLVVIPETIAYCGRAHEIRKGKYDDIFEMISHYYYCEVEETLIKRNLDDYEEEYGYELVYMTLQEAIENNEKLTETANVPWIDRDTGVMRKLIETELRDCHV